jgi:hypothetical protein
MSQYRKVNEIIITDNLYLLLRINGLKNEPLSEKYGGL